MANKDWLNPTGTVKGWALLFLILVSLVICSGRVYAQPVYYIDFNSGNDSNDGLSKSAPWRTIPGTLNMAGTTYLSSCWGHAGNCITFGNPIGAGTIFKLKPGTTYNSSDGGWIFINGGDLYPQNAAANNPIIFEPDPTWGSGPVILDGTGIPTATLEAFVVISQVDGVEFNGFISGGGACANSQCGIIIQNSPLGGILYKTHSFTTPAKNPVVSYVYFYNNGTSDTTGFAGGDVNALKFENTIGGSVSYCEFNGNNEYVNGFLAGESDESATNLTVSNSASYNNKGDPVADQGGRAFFALNSTITFRNDTAYNNFKGFDLGEVNANGGGIFYEILDSIAYGNMYGMNLNGVGENNQGETAPPGPANYYLINNLIYNNTFAGSDIYAGPWNTYVVGNVYANNGNGSSGSVTGTNLATSDDDDDSSAINLYLYNNIFYQPTGGVPKGGSFDSNFQEDRIVLYSSGTAATSSGATFTDTGQSFSDTIDYGQWVNVTSGAGVTPGMYFITGVPTSTTLTVTPPLGAGSGITYYIGSHYSLYSDYNSWIQYAAEPFGIWSFFDAAFQKTFAYGSNGPGQTSGSWYSNADEFGTANGHLHADPHSVGTGAANPATPPFVNAAANNFVLTGSYPGINLKSMPWYISDMGFDHNGNKRTSWDMGAYEYGSSISTTSASSAAGLVNVYAYPNPAVGGQAPVIRVEMGVLSSITITIFDASGRTVNSTTLSGAAPGITANGTYYYDYPWTGHITSGIYFAVIHGKAADGTIVKARTKFAVVR